MRPSIHSLFQFDADSVEDIYGGIAGVKLGLNNLSSLLASRQADENRDLVRCVFALLYLERRFASDQAMMSVVSRLQHASFRAEHFASNVHDLCHNLSGIYQDTLSKLKFRIKVTGSAQHLQNPKNADIIRRCCWPASARPSCGASWAGVAGSCCCSATIAARVPTTVTRLGVV